MGILIHSYHRKLKLKAESYLDYLGFVYYLTKAFEGFSSGRQSNRYGSFAPVRENNYVEFLVDGEEYFRSVAEEISRAKYEVMIAGWWISPEFLLIRPIDPLQP